MFNIANVHFFSSSMLTGRKLDLPTLDSLTATRSREDRIATATFNLYIAGLYSNHTLLLRGVACKIEENGNDRQPAWKMKKVLTLNCEFSLCGLMNVLTESMYSGSRFM